MNATASKDSQSLVTEHQALWLNFCRRVLGNESQDELRVGGLYTYFPPPTSNADNRHWPAIVEGFSKGLVVVRVFMPGSADGVIRRVSARRLVDQRWMI